MSIRSFFRAFGPAFVLLTAACSPQYYNEQRDNRAQVARHNLVTDSGTAGVLREETHRQDCPEPRRFDLNVQTAGLAQGASDGIQARVISVCLPEGVRRPTTVSEMAELARMLGVTGGQQSGPDGRYTNSRSMSRRGWGSYGGYHPGYNQRYYDRR